MNLNIYIELQIFKLASGVNGRCPTARCHRRLSLWWAVYGGHLNMWLDAYDRCLFMGQASTTGSSAHVRHLRCGSDGGGGEGHLCSYRVIIERLCRKSLLPLLPFLLLWPNHNILLFLPRLEWQDIQEEVFVKVVFGLFLQVFRKWTRLGEVCFFIGWASIHIPVLRRSFIVLGSRGLCWRRRSTHNPLHIENTQVIYFAELDYPVQLCISPVGKLSSWYKTFLGTCVDYLLESSHLYYV